MKHHALSLVMMSVLLITVGYPQQATTPNAQFTSPISEWEPSFQFDGELYPSFVLTMGGNSRAMRETARFFGDSLAFTGVTLRTSVPNVRVRVSIGIDGLADVSNYDAVLPDAGVQYTIAPVLRYNTVQLARINQSRPATAVYSVVVNGMELGSKTRSIRVRSVNDVPFRLIAIDGSIKNLSPLFAGYVNESHPYVQSVLQAALKYRAVDHFDGYQENAAIVRKQVFALWNVFQRAHVHYSSTTTASAASPKGKVFSQSVRFIDETIREQQANCVDGSVLFASVLYKIGIDPVLVLLPGHMFVGYYVDRQHRRIEFLETTLLGHGHQPSQYNLAFSPVLHPVETSESYRQFMTALQYANQEYQQKVAPHLTDGGMQYQLIDIRKAREQGINAIPRP